MKREAHAIAFRLRHTWKEADDQLGKRINVNFFLAGFVVEACDGPSFMTGTSLGMIPN